MKDDIGLGLQPEPAIEDDCGAERTVYGAAGNLIETHEHAAISREAGQQGPRYCRAITKVDAGCGA